MNLFGFVTSLDDGIVTSFVDTDGRYAFGAQPAMLRWGLKRLADALAGRSPADPLRVTGTFAANATGADACGWLPRATGDAVLRSFFDAKLHECIAVHGRRRLGLPLEDMAVLIGEDGANRALHGQKEDGDLVAGWNSWLRATSVDYHAAYRALPEVFGMAEFQNVSWDIVARRLLVAASPPGDITDDEQAERIFGLVPWLQALKQRLEHYAVRRSPGNNSGAWLSFFRAWQAQLRRSNPQYVLRSPVALAVATSALGKDAEGREDQVFVSLKASLEQLLDPFDEEPWELDGRADSKNSAVKKMFSSIPTQEERRIRDSCGGQ